MYSVGAFGRTQQCLGGRRVLCSFSALVAILRGRAVREPRTTVVWVSETWDGTTTSEIAKWGVTYSINQCQES